MLILQESKFLVRLLLVPKLLQELVRDWAHRLCQHNLTVQTLGNHAAMLFGNAPPNLQALRRNRYALSALSSPLSLGEQYDALNAEEGLAVDEKDFPHAVSSAFTTVDVPPRHRRTAAAVSYELSHIAPRTHNSRPTAGGGRDLHRRRLPANILCGVAWSSFARPPRERHGHIKHTHAHPYT